MAPRRSAKSNKQNRSDEGVAPYHIYFNKFLFVDLIFPRPRRSGVLSCKKESSCGSQSFFVPWSGTETLTATPSPPRFIVRRTHFGGDAKELYLFGICLFTSSTSCSVSSLQQPSSSPSSSQSSPILTRLNSTTLFPSEANILLT